MPKKPLDANKPRGPVTAYALFVRTCRDELRRKYPQLTVDYNVIAKKCSERWKVMNDIEKKRFNDTADLQRKRYKEEMATYLQEQSAKQQQQQQQQQQQSATSSILLQTPSTQYLQQQQLLLYQKKPAKKRERKPKDPHAPKKPLSAYFLFCADERPKVHGSQTGMSVSDVARELGIRWKNAPIELKNKYEQAASEKKHVYQAEMAIYRHQTSTSTSPPETPQTPLTPHDYQPIFSSSSIQQQQHSQLQHILQQQQQQHQQNFNSYDNGDTTEHPTEFDMITGGHSVGDNDV
ncbi:unnamed protein product [Rotaria sordida]|uniref:HMG box domain-containing protein n=1 Tax=Rotaria sordida TaxID=392033 RepID=A0A815SBX7_9BILA|nr:unnamed protein product [Rotaria sordida]CAF1488517.1 unnamed protein product [Rotaria sordida]